jgi:isoquinoline 1-oxidoreductase beta subunit
MSRPTRDPAVNGLSRRRFLAVSASAGGMLIGFSFPLVSRLARASAPPAPSDAVVNSWILIGSDNTVTVYVGSQEMGQGIISSLPQIVAEDLMVEWTQVKGMIAPPNPAFVNPGTGAQLTGGSMSVRGYYDALRVAGAAARDMLIAEAASVWGVDPGVCSAVGNGTIVNTQSSAVLAYAQLAAGAALRTPPTDPVLTPDANLRLIGTSVQRPDIPSKCDGTAIFGIDVSVPGMLHAVIKHCPSLGGTVVGTPSTPPGAIAVVALDNAVAVVAGDTFAAMRAAEEVNVEWSIPPSSLDLDNAVIAANARELIFSATTAIAESDGDVAASYAGAAHQVDLYYDVPYLAHATLESMNCSASVTATGCEIWAPTQAPGLVQATAAGLTGLSPDQVTVHCTFMGGGLGRKFELDYVIQAVRVSMALGQPVKLLWPREEDFANDQYRPMALVRVRAGLDSGGNVVAWWYRNVSPSILFQRGWIGPNDVDSQAVDGAIERAYAFGSRQVEYTRHTAAVPVGFWRSVGNSINAFMVESAIDELALLADMDPVDFRRRLLASDARSLAVLNAAAALGGWGTSLPSGHARGIAFHAAFGSIVAQVVEISGATPQQIKVHRVACVIDCGRVINPDTVEAQLQGAIVQGMTAALWGQMTFTAGAVSPRNFNRYKMMRMRDMPVVTVQVIQGGAPIGGVGEPGVPPIAPAIANAYATLTGTRLRTLPLTGPQSPPPAPPGDNIFSDGFD